MLMSFLQFRLFRSKFALRVFSLLFIIVTLLALFSLIILPTIAQQSGVGSQQDTPAAQEILQMLNTWRISQGLWPLRENTTLDKMAYDQASYVLSLPSIPNEGGIHLGQFGENPMTRAKLPQYNWPSYGNPANTAIGEIAYVGRNAAAARTFWENSSIHKAAALNPAYREVGVAALPQRFGHIYLVDLGARPNVLPAMADTSAHVLYLTNEKYAWAKAPWIRNVLKVRLFDSDGRPLDSDWEDWKAQIPLPADAGNAIYVEYMDETGVVALAPISLQMGGESIGSALLPTQTPSATPPPTRVPTLTPTRSGNTLSSTLVVTDTTNNTTTTPGTPVLTATNVFAAGGTPTATSASGATPNVLLLYDAKSFALINSTSAPINVSGLVFVGQKTTFAVARWSTQWLSGTLTGLAGSDCLQVWSWLEKNQLDKPSRCRQRRSILTIAPEQLFWKQGDFQVEWGQNALTVCRATDTSCEFATPS